MAQVVKAPGGRELAVKVLGHPTGEAVFLLHGTPGIASWSATARNFPLPAWNPPY